MTGPSDRRVPRARAIAVAATRGDKAIRNFLAAASAAMVLTMFVFTVVLWLGA